MTAGTSELSPAATRDAGRFADWVASVALDRAAAPRPASLRLFGTRAGLSGVEAGSCAVVFDGVLFERDELAERLTGGVSGPRTDAALVLDAYRTFGEAFPERISGMFSLALWDADKEVFLIARDPIGTLPLYYARTATELVASPSIDVLLAHPGVPRDANRAVLAEHLYHRWLHREETYFAGIRRLCPGHLLRVRRGTASISKYRDRFPEDRRIDWATEEDLTQFDGLLVRAVRRCLTGPSGINLSGGLDSVTVAALAAEESRRIGLPPLRAFSLAFPEPFSEEQTQRRVAADLGLPLTMMSIDEAVGPRGLLPTALEVSASRPTPLLNLWAPAYRRLGRAAGEQGCEVVLTGSGGDDWLTVTPLVAADLIRTADVAGLYRFWRMWHRSYRLSPMGAARLLWRYGGAPVLRGTARRALQRTAASALRAYRRRRVDALIPSYVAPRRQFRDELCERLASRYRAPDPEGFYVHALRLGLTSAVAMNELEEMWATGRQAGTRLGHPFWDVDLTELLFRTPPHLLSRGGRSKSLVRQALARRFPNLGFETHRKLGATPYMNSVLAGQGPAAWKGLGGAPKLAELDIVDSRGLDEVMRTKLLSGESRDAFHMWYLLSVESWLQGHSSRSTTRQTAIWEEVRA